MFRRYLPLLSVLILFHACSLLDWENPSRQETAGPGVMTLRYGSCAYRIGGQDGAGNPASTVEMASLGQDGSVGVWTNTGALPSGRSHGAIVAAGNMIYVLGGLGPEGVTKEIFYTEIRADGSLGFGTDRRWEKGLRPLPWPLYSATAVFYDGRIILAGGAFLGDEKSQSILHARIYQDGQVGQWYLSPETFPVGSLSLLATLGNGRLYLAEPEPEIPGLYSMAASWDIDGYGALEDFSIEAGLPGDFFDPLREPPAPVVMPGSGLVPSRSMLLVAKGPGTTVRYRKDGLEVTEQDPEWIPPSTGYKITVAETFEFRAFDSQGRASRQVSAAYVPRTTGFLVWPQCAIPPSSDPSQRTACVMDGSASWFSFQGDVGKTYSLDLFDSASDPQDVSHTAEVKATLFEGDYYSPVVDSQGRPMVDLRSADDPRDFTPGPGKYYLYAVELDGAANKSFSAAFLLR